jgi:hypothetical protein
MVTSDARDAAMDESATSTVRRPAVLHHRQHHVTKDYTYVRRDLLTILGVGAVVIAFIVAMSFVVT